MGEVMQAHPAAMRGESRINKVHIEALFATNGRTKVLALRSESRRHLARSKALATGRSVMRLHKARPIARSMAPKLAKCLTGDHVRSS
jgi:hypothetical protein